MKLSELAFNTIKKTILYENNREFSLLNFREYCYELTTNNGSDTEGYSISPDYKRTTDNIFIVLNSAFQRLASLDKLHPVQAEVIVNGDNTIDLSNFIPGVNYVLNIVNAYGQNIGFRNLSINKITLLENYKNKSVLLEYYPEMRVFDFSDCSYHEGDNEETTTDNDIDLRSEFGISNTTCEYISIYAKGLLLNDIDPSQANSLINQAEAYFMDLLDFGGEILHYQNKVKEVFRI